MEKIVIILKHISCFPAAKAGVKNVQQGRQVCPNISIMVCKVCEQGLGKTPRRGTPPAVAPACHTSLELGT